MNITQIPAEITESCFNWCREQNFIHQSNVEIGELTFIAIALISLVVHNLIYTHSEFLMESSGMNEYQITKVYDVTYLLAFLMLVLYIIYMVFFR